MDKQRKPRFEYDEEAEQLIFQQINDSYQSGVIDLDAEHLKEQTK